MTPSKYKRVKGIGNVTFSVLGEVTVPIMFPPSYQITVSKFVVIPEDVTEFSLVIGFDILRKEHLLLGAFAGELVLRKGNRILSLAWDLRDSQVNSAVPCTLLDDVNIIPNLILANNDKISRYRKYDKKSQFEPLVAKSLSFCNNIN